MKLLVPTVKDILTSFFKLLTTTNVSVLAKLDTNNTQNLFRNVALV